MDYCLWSSRLKDISALPFNGSNGVNKGLATRLRTKKKSVIRSWVYREKSNTKGTAPSVKSSHLYSEIDKLTCV